jgi:hypothetical protein
LHGTRCKGGAAPFASKEQRGERQTELLGALRRVVPS